MVWVILEKRGYKSLCWVCKGYKIFFDWNYDSDVIIVSAYTGVAACQMPDGKTLHSWFNGYKSINSRKDWFMGINKVLIIDEVSSLSEHLLEKIDKHMRVLKGENDILFEGCHIIFLGDF